MPLPGQMQHWSPLETTHQKILNEARAAKQWNKTSALTYLIWAEQNHHCYAAFWQHTKPKLAGGLAYIMIALDSSQLPTKIIDQEEMDDTLLDYCQTHFAKARGTPFMAEPLSHLLQNNGITPFRKLVSQGCTQLEDFPLDEPTRALLTHLKSKTKDMEHLHPLVYEELQNGIMKWPKKHHVPTQLTPWHLQVTLVAHANQGWGKSSDTPWVDEPLETRLQCTLPHLWHHISCIYTHLHPQPMKNGLGNLHWKRLRQSRPEQTLMHYDFWSRLTASSQIALGLWSPSKEQKGSNANTSAR